MSDEEVVRSDEEGDDGPSEAQLAMQKRRQQQTVSTSGLDEEAQEMLEQNRQDREKMSEEINELKERSVVRKREREQEEREQAERRESEEQRRKAEEEDRKTKKNEEEVKKKEERAVKMAEFDKWKNPQTPNFVISRKDRPAGPSGAGGEEEEEGHVEKKSREQLEAEKQAILKQRIQPCDTSGMDPGKLAEKARELHNLLARLESEKYDLERRFKAQMNDMQELAERARGQNKVGKSGSIKRVQLSETDVDTMQEKFAGCPPKIVMYSQFERQMDKRPYDDRQTIFKGAVYGYAADKIPACRKVIWDQSTGLPLYEDIPGMVRPDEEEEE